MVMRYPCVVCLVAIATVSLRPDLTFYETPSLATIPSESSI